MRVDPHPSDNRIKLRHYKTFKSWAVRLQVKGKQKLVTLVAAPNDDAAALTEGRAIIAMMQKGIDPEAHRRVKSAEEKALHDRAAADQVTLGEVVERFLASPELLGLRPKTLSGLTWALRSAHIASMREKRLCDVDQADIEKLHKAMQAHTTTFRKVVGALKQLYGYAMRNRWTAYSPVHGYKLPKPKVRAEPFIKTGELSDWSELAAIVAAAAKFEQSAPYSQYPELWRVQMLTGLRPEAVERLEWRDVAIDTELPTITIRAEVSKLKRESQIPISKACRDVLRRVRAKKPTLWTEVQRESALIWPGRTGNPLLKPDREVAFIDGVTGRSHFRPQRFRDTFVTWCDWRAVPYGQIARLIDWSAQGRLKNYAKHDNPLSDDRALVERWATELSEHCAALETLRQVA